MTTALVLSGGGARGAYQVGVLKGVAELVPSGNPFPILCGTSAGAINTLGLAGRPGSFAARVASLEKMWRGLTAEKIYRTDLAGVARNSWRLLRALAAGRERPRKAVALLDNSPLRRLLASYVSFREVDQSIASGYLSAVAITAMSYSTGLSTTFFQGEHPNWQRFRRRGVRTALTLDHLMASAAIPTLFPPVRIGNRFYGDGALRQLKPLSPALHLGAERLFVIGVSDNPRHAPFNAYDPWPPTLAQMIGHMLNSAFIDAIEADLETLRSINQMAGVMRRAGIGATLPYREIDVLAVSPSRPINELAEQHLRELPGTVRAFLRLVGAETPGGGTSSASYLLFEPGFLGELIDLGYRDCLAQADEVRAFFAAAGEVPSARAH
ncbi:MAG: hypothetical protein KatS3mg124_0077 [Porticoccaceae bacterium]|nr:MAG: hypothetical protein KatS3mg124_0077 [Porticoccaceae bacterium]